MIAEPPALAVLVEVPRIGHLTDREQRFVPLAHGQTNLATETPVGDPLVLFVRRSGSHTANRGFSSAFTHPYDMGKALLSACC